jgi:hypothetical protein
VETTQLLASNTLTAHRTQTQTANTVDVRATINTTSCPVVSTKKRTIAKDPERKRARESWAACKEKRNREA